MAPKRRRDEAEKAEEEKDHTTSTKCGLAGLLSEKIEADGVAVTREESLAAVDFLVAALTRLRFEALCLLGLVAVRMCEDARREGQGLQPHCATCRRLRKTELVEDDMYAAICAVSVCDLTEQGRKRGRPSKRDQHPEDDLFRHVCEEHFPRDEEAAGARVNRSGLTPFLPPLSKGVFTNVKNHYAANFAAWLARSFRCRIDDELRELRERYAKHVFIIDEYKTSKTCYNCGCQEMAIKRLGGLKEGQRPWSVKVCNDCLTTWNRDVSAANVICVLLLLKLMGFERPTKLQRPPWPAAAAGPG